jgi:hypothetical protein
MGHPQVRESVQLMTQNGGIPAQLQGDREGQKPATTKSGGMWKFLYPPVYLDVHPITPTHHHIGLVYFATAASDQVTLAADEHEAIRWFSEAELHDPACGIQPDVLF